MCAANRSLITQLETLRKAALTVSRTSADANAAAARDSLARAERSATIAEEIAAAMDERLVDARRAAASSLVRSPLSPFSSTLNIEYVCFYLCCCVLFASSFSSPSILPSSISMRPSIVSATIPFTVPHAALPAWPRLTTAPADLFK